MQGNRFLRHTRNAVTFISFHRHPPTVTCCLLLSCLPLQTLERESRFILYSADQGEKQMEKEMNEDILLQVC